jgi:hypothetical protein
MLASPRRRIPTPPKHPLRGRCVCEGVAARLLVSFAQLCPLGKPAVGFGNGMHDTSRLQVGHAGGDSESLGFQSTPAVCIAGSVIQSLLHQLKSLPSTRKRAWSNWVPALRGQRRGERATSGPQARSDRWAPFEGIDPATPLPGKSLSTRGSLPAAPKKFTYGHCPTQIINSRCIRIAGYRLATWCVMSAGCRPLGAYAGGTAKRG